MACPGVVASARRRTMPKTPPANRSYCSKQRTGTTALVFAAILIVALVAIFAVVGRDRSSVPSGSVPMEVVR